MSEVNKALCRRLIEECYNQGRLETAIDCLHPGYRDYDAPAAFATGVLGYQQRVALYRTAFPDLSVTVDLQVAENNVVTTRWTLCGTHTGNLLGVAPTRRKVSVTGIDIDYIQEGRILERWQNFDQMGLMVQLGVLPQPQTSPLA